MAVDTEARRASCLSIAAPHLRALPPESGSVTQPDRQAVSFCYPGIAADEPGEEPEVIETTNQNSRRRLRPR